MSVLYDWQKPSYVLAGKPWGDGKDGNATISSCPNTYSAGTATINQKNGTCASANLANGDLFIAIQMQGTGAGNRQFNMVASGGGTTSITCTKDFKYDFVSGAQFIKVPRYAVATITAHSVTAWNGTTGGKEIICAKTSIIVNGAINASGGNGAGGTSGGGVTSETTGGGFRGGRGGSIAHDGNGGVANGGRGESYAGTYPSYPNIYAYNNYGGGGVNWQWGDAGGGGGGGHANYGSNGTGDANNNGRGGNSYGIADLTSIYLGSGGGGGNRFNNEQPYGAGGSGGGIVTLISNTITVSAGVLVNGGNGGGNSTGRGNGGGGAGGSVLLICNTASLGSNQIVSLGGSAPTNAGAGSVGRIAVHHKGTVTGTTNPAFTSIEDLSLVEIAGASMIQSY